MADDEVPAKRQNARASIRAGAIQHVDSSSRDECRRQILCAGLHGLGNGHRQVPVTLKNPAGAEDRQAHNLIGARRAADLLVILHDLAGSHSGCQGNSRSTWIDRLADQWMIDHGRRSTFISPDAP